MLWKSKNIQKKLIPNFVYQQFVSFFVENHLQFAICLFNPTCIDCNGNQNLDEACDKVVLHPSFFWQTLSKVIAEI